MSYPLLTGSFGIKELYYQENQGIIRGFFVFCFLFFFKLNLPEDNINSQDHHKEVSKSMKIPFDSVFYQCVECSQRGFVLLHYISLPLPQMQMGIVVSLKPCLDLCSMRWFKPRRNLVNSFVPYRLLISKLLFGEERNYA